MSVPVFPTLRKYYAGIDNPLFLGDITTADESAIAALLWLSGCKIGDFRIISGLEYTLGTPNTYTPGIIFFNDDFFYCDTAFAEGLYLATSYVDVLLETFDTVPPTAKNIYTNQVATSTSSAGGNTPAFVGNMNSYRINNKYLQQQITAILTITGALGTAADADLGTGAGQILTADQTYTQAQVNSLLLSRAPSCVGTIVTVHDFDGTFLANFDGTGLGIVYPWYNALTGERWGRCNGVATAGGNTAPNLAGTTSIGEGTDAGSNTFTEGNPYGSNTKTLAATDLPVLTTDPEFEGGSVSGTATMYLSGSIGRNKIGIPVNSGSPNNPISLIQSSVADYKIIRLV